VKGQPPISSIYKLGQQRSMDDPFRQWGRLERLRRQAWQKAGVIAVKPQELPEDLAERLQEWADETYGRR
jgi:hypothetical protein